MRRVARETAFKILFEYSFQKEVNTEAFDILSTADDLTDDDKEYIKRVYLGVIGKYDELRSTIESHLENYAIDRLYRPDYIVLLLAVFELNTKEAPAKVIASEAVSLAKKYGTEKSGAFVNGVLAKIIKE